MNDKAKDIQVFTFKDSKEWEDWLQKNYTLNEGIWMKVAKKGSGIASIAIQDALDVALCYGWIDGLRKSYDENYYLQRYTPRRPRSLWSKVNIGKVEALIAAGRMKEPGFAEIAKAKADGRWEAAYESQKNAAVPPDFLSELEKNKKAKTTFESLNKANKYAFLWRLMTTRNPEKRSEKLQKLIQMLESGKKFY
jgi:uncharacterized protein YdeI (YjbR/CyaY-like superfamily)